MLSRTLVLLCLLSVCPVLAVDSAKALSSPGATPSEQKAADNALSILKSLSLVDQDDKPVTAERLAGKIVLLNFIFTHCTTSCPVQTEQLAQLQRMLPKQLLPRVLFVSVSVDPANDHPTQLKEYAQESHADLQHWAFVTGPPSQIDRFNRAFDVFARDNRQPGAGFHTTDIRLFNTSGQVIQRYSGVSVDKPRLLREIEALSALQAAQGTN